MKKRVLYSYERLSSVLDNLADKEDIYRVIIMAMDSWREKVLSNYAFSVILQKSADLIKKL